MAQISKAERQRRLLQAAEERKKKDEEGRSAKRQFVSWYIGAILINAGIAGGLFLILYFTA